MINDRDLAKTYGLSDDEIEALSADGDAYASGDWPSGVTRVGRPRKFDEEQTFIGFRDTVAVRAAIDMKAAAAGMSRSDYLRDLVRRDLASA